MRVLCIETKWKNKTDMMIHKNTRLITLLLIICMPSILSAVNPAQKRRSSIAWSASQSKQTGLYRRDNGGGLDGWVFSLNANYYYGDVDAQGIIFKDGFRTNNLGGSIGVAYEHPIPNSNHFALRYQANLGLIRGNAWEDRAADPIRSDQKVAFYNISLEPSVGVEFYPSRRAGFYLYAGLALNMGLINDAFERQGATSATDYGHPKMHFSALPMAVLEIGYDINFKTCMLRFSASAHQGLLDAYHCNLDGYPNPYEQINGNTGGYGSPQYKPYSMNEWADGYFQVTVGFSWKGRKCEVCRMMR